MENYHRNTLVALFVFITHKSIKCGSGPNVQGQWLFSQNEWAVRLRDNTASGVQNFKQTPRYYLQCGDTVNTNDAVTSILCSVWAECLSVILCLSVEVLFRSKVLVWSESRSDHRVNNRGRLWIVLRDNIVIPSLPSLSTGDSGLNSSPRVLHV